jgi:hypothetical protein
MERRQMYSHLKIDNRVFYTFVGEFTFDYGPSMAFLILIIISILFNKVLSKKVYHFGHVLLLFLLYKICTHGFGLYGYTNVGGNLSILFIIFLYILFQQTRYKRVKRR